MVLSTHWIARWHGNYSTGTFADVDQKRYTWTWISGLYSNAGRSNLAANPGMDSGRLYDRQYCCACIIAEDTLKSNAIER